MGTFKVVLDGFTGPGPGREFWNGPGRAVPKRAQTGRKYNKSLLNVDNLYLDCNSIIYDAYAKMKTDTITESIASNIIKNVISKFASWFKLFTLETI